jgi:hypothetical protein
MSSDINVRHSESRRRVWRVVSVDDEKVVLKKVRGWKSVEVKWAEWARGWELKFP